jgi:pyrophosphatase PpaX
MPVYQTVLFDLDGTLIDSVDLIVDSYLHTFTTHGLPVLSREEILAGLGTPLNVVFGEFTTDSGEIERLIATYRGYNLAHHDQRIRAYPGVVEMVQRLRTAGRRLGLVTSKNRSGAERGLRAIGLGDAMEVIVGSDDVQRPKPHAEPVEKALTLLGMPPDTCVYVGDSQHDIHAGRAAGTFTAGITWGPFPREHLELVAPDYFCDTPGDVLRIAGVS